MGRSTKWKQIRDTTARCTLAGTTQENLLGQLAAGQAAPLDGIAASGHEMLVALRGSPKITESIQIHKYTG
jgi:hypothetical protein